MGKWHGAKTLMLGGVLAGSIAFALYSLIDPGRQDQLAQIKKHGVSAISKRLPQATLPARLKEFRPLVQPRLRSKFEKVGLSYPPSQVTLVGLKEERSLQVYARNNSTQPWVRVDDLPILGASGGAGPKLKEGDRQVPEGIYQIESLNPNSRFHLSLRINYPNAFDRAMARRDDRRRLGGDIMIHGGALSAGCLAMGDPASEDLFILVADVGIENTTVILAPFDFRTREQDVAEGSPPWTASLYRKIDERLKAFP